MFNDSLLSHKSDHWSTPSFIYNQVLEKGYFDPCPLHADFDGLSCDWLDFNFVNPPYSNISSWVDKSILENKKGNYVVLLVPSRTDTKWFRKLWDYGAHFLFITGRLRFNGKGYAPFPSMLVILKGACSSCRLIDREEIIL